MSNNKNNEFAGEIISADVKRKGIYELGKVDRVPPVVGIFDAPTRCFVVNQEWWSHIAGMVHLLADVVSWKDAEDDDYFAITEILRFMQGVECMDFSLRQNPADDCILQQTTDGGTTWTTAFNFALCLTAQLSTISTQLSAIETQNIINSGYSTSETTVSDAYTAEELQDFGVQADVCNTSGKDAIYGAISQLVRYINDKNVDFLQNVGQAANLAAQVERGISAIPVIGLLPADEAAGYISFIVEELSEEYLATVDEELLQSVICDLFCIAVNSDCHLDFNDVFNYFAGKVSPTFSNVSTTFLNLVQFAFTGTFSGDDYFYFMCYFQLLIAGQAQRFLDIPNVQAYAQQAAAGFNSPDNDWSIFCLDCPTQYRLFKWDFTTQLQGGWAVDVLSPGNGEFTAQGWKGSDLGGSKRIRIAALHDPTWIIHGLAFTVERVNGANNAPTPDSRNFAMRPTANSNTGVLSNIGLSGGAGNGVIRHCTSWLTATNYTSINQLYLEAGVTDVDASSEIYIKSYEVLYSMTESPAGATVIETKDMCSL